jgi:hypothetical protein
LPLREGHLPPALFDPERESGLELFGGVLALRDRSGLRQFYGSRGRRVRVRADGAATRLTGNGTHDGDGEKIKVSMRMVVSFSRWAAPGRQCERTFVWRCDTVGL